MTSITVPTSSLATLLNTVAKVVQHATTCPRDMTYQQYATEVVCSLALDPQAQPWITVILAEGGEVVFHA